MFLEALGTYMILVSSTVKEDQFLHLWLKFRRNIENGCFVGVYVDFQSELSIPYSVIKQFLPCEEHTHQCCSVLQLQGNTMFVMENGLILSCVSVIDR